MIMINAQVSRGAIGAKSGLVFVFDYTGLVDLCSTVFLL